MNNMNNFDHYGRRISPQTTKELDTWRHAVARPASYRDDIQSRRAKSVDTYESHYDVGEQVQLYNLHETMFQNPLMRELNSNPLPPTYEDPDQQWLYMPDDVMNHYDNGIRKNIQRRWQIAMHNRFIDANKDESETGTERTQRPPPRNMSRFIARRDKASQGYNRYLRY